MGFDTKGSLSWQRDFKNMEVNLQQMTYIMILSQVFTIGWLWGRFNRGWLKWRITERLALVDKTNWHLYE